MLPESIKSFFRRKPQSQAPKEKVPMGPPKPAAEPKPESVPEPEKEIVYGTYGRLEIPDLSISIPLNGVESGSAQQVIDMEDSAVYLNWPNQTVIADHCHQANFSNLNRAIQGHTKAFIASDPDSKKWLVCCKTQVGHIRIGEKSNSLFDHDWNPVYHSNSGGLTMYTCIEKSAPDVMDVRLTYWKTL